MQQVATRHPLPLPAGSLLRAPAALLARLAAWQHQAEERAHLLRLTEQELADLGLSHVTVEVRPS